MKVILLIIFWGSVLYLQAQGNFNRFYQPLGGIHLITMQGNMLKGLLLGIKDTSVIVYPGTGKEWKRNAPYKPIEFGYSSIRELSVKRRNRSWKKYPVNGSALLFTEFQKNGK
ncbi:MAG: hypothetical protein J0L54_02905 [Chitinophagales bacterium]|nr:hypothetical protein [Chitinophagales bacterium]